MQALSASVERRLSRGGKLLCLLQAQDETVWLEYFNLLILLVRRPKETS